MFRTYKYRIYPNATQRKKIEQTFGVCRLVYNLGLGIKIDAWKYAQRKVSSYDLINQLPDLKKDHDWIKEVNSQALCASILNIDKAFKNFFKGSGYPKFQSKYKKQSFQATGNKREVSFEKETLTIPKIANIPIRISSRKFTGKIKTVTISKSTTGKYYAAILVDTMVEVPKKHPVDPEKTIGIDLGITDLVITSEVIKVANPAFLRKGIERLKVLQRRASKKKKGSKSRKKANMRVALQHEKIRNQRIDFLHKLTTGMVRDSQTTTFCMEDLSVSNMIKNHSLAQAISDVSWYELKRQMEYKCEWYGKNFLQIGRFDPSTKTCSECDEVNHNLTLADREWVCPGCGTLHDRDINSGKYIKKRALAIHSGRGTPVEPVEQSALSRGNEAGTLENLPRKRGRRSI